jgi:hypothetical protein
MLMSPLKISFGMKRLECNMNEAVETCYNIFKTVVEKVGTQNWIQEALAYNILPTCIGWKLLKQVKCKDGELVSLAFKFKGQSSYKAPCEEWLKLIEKKHNEICGNYLTREHKDISSAFGSRGKLRLLQDLNILII